LLVFCFGMIAMLAWMKWLDTGRLNFYLVSLVAFLIAAVSKETFWVFALLMLAITCWERRRKALVPALLQLSPLLAISAGYIIFIWMTKIAGPQVDDRFHLAGGTWIPVFFRGLWDLLFPFGLAAIAILAWA